MFGGRAVWCFAAGDVWGGIACVGSGRLCWWPGRAEARSFLRDLNEHATQRQFVYANVWLPSDLVMWDITALRCTTLVAMIQEKFATCAEPR
jgi:hypothetical protein